MELVLAVVVVLVLAVVCKHKPGHPSPGSERPGSSSSNSSDVKSSSSSFSFGLLKSSIASIVRTLSRRWILFAPETFFGDAQSPRFSQNPVMPADSLECSRKSWQSRNFVSYGISCPANSDWLLECGGEGFEDQIMRSASTRTAFLRQPSAHKIPLFAFSRELSVLNNVCLHTIPVTPGAHFFYSFDNFDCLF